MQAGGGIGLHAHRGGAAGAYTVAPGHEPYDPLAMFKVTLLEHFYDLSDSECEF